MVSWLGTLYRWQSQLERDRVWPKTGSSVTTCPPPSQVNNDLDKGGDKAVGGPEEDQRRDEIRRQVETTNLRGQGIQGVHEITRNQAESENLEGILSKDLDNQPQSGAKPTYFGRFQKGPVLLISFIVGIISRAYSNIWET